MAQTTIPEAKRNLFYRPILPVVLANLPSDQSDHFIKAKEYRVLFHKIGRTTIDTGRMYEILVTTGRSESDLLNDGLYAIRHFT